MSDETILLRLEGIGDRVMPLEFFGGWPLPNRIACDTSPGDPMLYQFLNLEDGEEPPPEADRVYMKISESELPEPPSSALVMRGAEYRIAIWKE